MLLMFFINLYKCIICCIVVSFMYNPCLLRIILGIEERKVILIILSISRADFPHLSGHNSWGTKITPLKGTSAGSLSRQKSMGGKATERAILSSPASVQSSVKRKGDAMTKQSGKLCSIVWPDCLVLNERSNSLYLFSSCHFVLQRLWASEIGVKMSVLGLLGQKVC